MRKHLFSAVMGVFMVTMILLMAVPLMLIIARSYL